MTVCFIISGGKWDLFLMNLNFSYKLVTTKSVIVRYSNYVSAETPGISQ